MAAYMYQIPSILLFISLSHNFNYSLYIKYSHYSFSFYYSHYSRFAPLQRRDARTCPPLRTRG